MKKMKAHTLHNGLSWSVGQTRELDGCHSMITLCYREKGAFPDVVKVPNQLACVSQKIILGGPD